MLFQGSAQRVVWGWRLPRGLGLQAVLYKGLAVQGGLGAALGVWSLRGMWGLGVVYCVMRRVGVCARGLDAMPREPTATGCPVGPGWVPHARCP